MATYYWVGGSGTWNSTSTTNWSSTSGGSGGAGFPTSADDVVFDSASSGAAYNVTTSTTAGVSNCRNMTVSAPASGAVNFNTGNGIVYCYGSSNISATNVTWSTTGSLYHVATTTGNTVSINISIGNIFFTGSGDWTLTANIAAGRLYFRGGTFNSGNYTISHAFGFLCDGSVTRTMNLGSSSLTVTNYGTYTFVETGLTLNSGTSTITNNNSIDCGTGLTFYDITGAGSIISTSATFNNIVFTGTSSITGTVSCSNFTINSPSSAGIYALSVTGSITISGTFTANGSSTNQRVFVYSSIIGSSVTLSSSSVSISNCDFRDITASGSASPFSGTSLGDCGGNSNITFPAAKTVYWNLTGSQNWSATAWATSSGGTPAAANFPLAQDTAVIDNSGAATTITQNATFNVGTVDFSGRTNAVTYANSSSSIYVYGSWKNGSGVTITGSSSGGIYMYARSPQTILSAGKTFPCLIYINSTSTITLSDALSISVALGTVNSLSVVQGTFDTQGYNITLGGAASNPAFYSNGSLTRIINLNNSTITSSTAATSVTSLNFSGSNITLNAGTSSFSMNGGANFGTNLTFYNYNITNAATGGSISGTNATFNTLTTSTNSSNFSFATATSFVWNSSGACAFTGTATNYTFNPTAAASSFTLAASTKGNLTVNNTVAGYFTLSLSGNVTLTGALTTTATNAAMRTVIQSSAVGTSRTLTAASASLADVDFYWITAAGAATWSGTRVGNIGNNSGITTSTPKTVYWNLAGAQNWNATGWCASSGGTPDANQYPLPQDDAVFDDTGSVTGNITMLTTPFYPTINMSARTSAMTLVTAVANFSGGLRLGTGTTISGTSAFTFIGDNPAPIQCSGKTLANALTFSKVSGTATQQDAFLSSTTVTHNNGTYDANNYNFTATSFTSSNSNTRAITMGSGTWSLTGTGTPWTLTTTTNLTFSGASSTITYTNATASSTKIFAGGGLSYGGLSFGGGSAASQIFQITGSNSFASLSHTKTVAFTIQFTATTTTSIGSWNISGTAGNLVTIGSVTAASYTLTKTGGGYVNANYLSISRSTATPSTSTWFAGANSTNGGNNSGWIFSAPPFGNFFMLWRG